jgi:hypothetical protein
MSSLYLGTIGNKDSYEIHALTDGLPFREFTAAEIGDRKLFDRLVQERYKLLAEGCSFYCTAIHPDTEKKIETNPHDTREGTVHFVALDRHGEIDCALSVAVDTGMEEGGEQIGLPLENRWRRNGYPLGASLDRFRERYLRLHYGRNRDVGPWEMAELYRHFRSPAAGNDQAVRLGLYTACGQLLVREAIRKGRTPSWLWVFDAIPAYFNLYRWAGGAVLRDWTVRDQPRWFSPQLKDMKKEGKNGQKSLFHRGEMISRPVQVPIPQRQEGGLEFVSKDVPFLDGLVDYCHMEYESVRRNPLFLSGERLGGFSLQDRVKLRIALAITGRRAFEQFHGGHLFSNLLNRWIRKRYCAAAWSFNHIGQVTAKEGESYHYPV